MEKTKSRKLADYKEKFLKSFSKINWKTWYTTIFFFVLLLGVSLWIWWESFYQPVPSQQVIVEIEGSKEDFEGMKKRITKIIGVLKERESNFNNTPSFGNQRELFFDIEVDGVEETEEASSEEQSSESSENQEESLQ